MVLTVMYCRTAEAMTLRTGYRYTASRTIDHHPFILRSACFCLLVRRVWPFATLAKVGGVTKAPPQPQPRRDFYCSSRPLPVVGIETGKYVDLYNKSFSEGKVVPAALVRRL